jgi:hypothetical protein
MPSTNVANINFNSIDLWDKVIDVTLITADGETDTIQTPDPGEGMGRKPTIRLKGKLIPQNTLLQVELRVTNLYLARPLSDYKTVKVQAGYRKTLQVGFTGSILVAFQELPGPDGVTCFQLLLGSMDAWTGATFSGEIAEGTMLSAACQQIADGLGLTLQYNISPDVPISKDVQFNGLLKDLIPHIEQLFEAYDDQGTFTGVKICPYNNLLLVYRGNLGMTQTQFVRLDYITLAKHTSAGYEIQAPWVPGLAPGNIIIIDPKYFRQSFGGSQVKSGNTFRILMLEFDFCTSDATNYMSLVSISAPEATS